MLILCVDAGSCSLVVVFHAQVDTVVFDKTGTLTAGKPQVTQVATLASDYTEQQVLQLAAAVEQQASHPLARAVVAAAAKAASAGQGAGLKLLRNAPGSPFGPGSHLADAAPLDPSSFTQQPGSGVLGSINGHPVFVGNLEWVEQQGALQSVPEHILRSSGSPSTRGSQGPPVDGPSHTTVYVGVDGCVVGTICMADAVRKEASATIEDLHAQGIRTIMLSGQSSDCSCAGTLLVPLPAAYLPQAARACYYVVAHEGALVGHRSTHVTGHQGAEESPFLRLSEHAIAMPFHCFTAYCVGAGDREASALEVAAQVGISAADVYAGVKPAGKASVIESLKAENLTVAMVGDGVNDTAALAAANVGIAMGGGVDAAAEVAKVVLLGDQVHQVSDAIHLSKKTMEKIKQNLAWAFGYNLVGIPLAAGALLPSMGIALTPSISGALMGLSSVMVVGNSLLLQLEANKLKGAGAYQGSSAGSSAVVQAGEGGDSGRHERLLQQLQESEEGLSAAKALSLPLAATGLSDVVAGRDQHQRST